MSTKRNIKFVAMFAILIIFTGGSAVMADLSESEVREVNKYRLTEERLKQFAKATKNLAEAAKKNPNLFRPAEETDVKGEGLAAMVEVTEKLPEVKRAISDAGMTAREYWTFQLAMVYGGTGHMVRKAGGKVPPEYSVENIDFFAANEAEFMKLNDDMKVLQDLNKDQSGTGEEEEEEIEE